MALLLVVCGVTGTGKTTVGKLIVERCGGAFHDADDYHSQASIAKMRSGRPLSDADREHWLDALADLLASRADHPANTILACSALCRSYRQRLAAAAPGRVHFALLSGDRQLILERMQSRRDHFMPPDLLDSQLATLEVDHDCPQFDIAPPPGEVAAAIIHQYPALCQPA